MSQVLNRRVAHEIETWGNLFRSKKAKVQRQGRTVAQAEQNGDEQKIRAAKKKLEDMREDYYLTKTLLLKGRNSRLRPF